MKFKRKISKIAYTLGIMSMMGISFILSSCFLFSSKKYEVKVVDQSKSDQLDKNTELNVYIENSGSMYGYVVPGADFTDDLYRYISRMSRYSSKTKLNYINSKIIPINEIQATFFQNLSASSFKAAGGNMKYSDIVTMMKAMLATAKKNTVSIFASDCILDIDKGNPNIFFKKKQTTLTETIIDYKTKHPDFGIRVLCLKSNFDGFLFPVSGPIKVNNQRPYYIWIFGPQNLIGKLMKNVPDSEMNGHILHSVAYSSATTVPNNIGGDNRPISNDGSVIVKNNNMNFDLYLDLTNTLKDETVLNNSASYEISPYLTIEKISKIENPKSKYSHILKINLRSASNASNLFVGMKKNNVPSWVNEQNDETGNKLKTTCGIKYLITGIKEAFDGVNPVTVNLKLNNK